MSGFAVAKNCLDARKMPEIFENFYEVEAVIKIIVSDREDTINSSFGVGHNVKKQLRNNSELIHYNITKQLNFIRTHYLEHINLYLEKIGTNDENYVYKKLIKNNNIIELVEVPFEKREDGDWIVSENWSGKILEIPTFEKDETIQGLLKAKSNKIYPVEIDCDDDYEIGFQEIKI